MDESGGCMARVVSLIHSIFRRQIFAVRIAHRSPDQFGKLNCRLRKQLVELRYHVV